LGKIRAFEATRRSLQPTEEGRQDWLATLPVNAYYAGYARSLNYDQKAAK
jgi:hypothetical protein